jgi:hypothetical protein
MNLASSYAALGLGVIVPIMLTLGISQLVTFTLRVFAGY